VLVLVDIQFDDLDLPACSTAICSSTRRDHAARTAPFGPEVDQHWRVGVDLGLEGCVGLCV